MVLEEQSFFLKLCLLKMENKDLFARSPTFLSLTELTRPVVSSQAAGALEARVPSGALPAGGACGRRPGLTPLSV